MRLPSLQREGRRILPGCLMVLLVVVAYLPALGAGFVWDDDHYVTENPLLTAPDGLWKIWFSAHSQSQYFPLVYTTFRLEHLLWGFHPLGYHLVNVLCHATNALLVWVLLRRLALPGAWLAAAIFALHPVQVESVAWVCELKNLESTLFYLLALLAWLSFTERGTARPWLWYGLALLSFLLALFAKTTACTLPAAMALVLWLRREPVNWRRLLEMTPFVAVGVAMGLLSVWWEGHLGNYDEGPGLSFSPVARLLIATRAVWFYAGKLFWPASLTFSYPQWEINPREPVQYLWLVGCVAVALLVWQKRKAWGRGVWVAVVFFVAVLSPLLGFISNYTFHYSLVADHYQYLAALGLMAGFAGLVSSQTVAGQLGRPGRWILTTTLLLVLGGLTWRQAGIYRNLETLWSDTLAKNPHSWMAHTNLGQLLADEGRWDEALPHFQEAVQFHPDDAPAQNNLGVALANQGELAEAIRHYAIALQINPDFAMAQSDLGAALASLGRPDEAADHFRRALQLNPKLYGTWMNFGDVLDGQGKLDAAVASYRQAVQLEPQRAEPLVKLGNSLVAKGQFDEATGCYRQALALNPDNAEIHYNLGAVLAHQGKNPDARKQFEEAVRSKPGFPEAQAQLRALGR